MAEADVVEYSSKFTRAKRNVDGSQQQVASNGGSKVTLKRVAVVVLCALLVATVIARFFTCYKYSQTMEKLQKLTEENEAMKNLTEKTVNENSQTMEKFQKLTDEYEAMKKVTDTKYSQTMEKFQKLTDEYEAMKNLTDEGYLKCEEGWERHGTQCYYFSTNELTWSESRDECRQRGGDLVKIDSVEEQSFLEQKLREKMIHPEDKYWIGLTDSKTEGTWLWTDGSPLNESLTFWSSGEPDDWKGEDSDGEDCVKMGDKGGSDLKTWFDKSCKKPHRSICEKRVSCSST